MQLSALIVDDEPMARERIADLLQARANISVVGECANGREAVAAIREQRPDIVFLDVQMPEMGGFDTLAALNDDELPEIVFATAHDKFALQAFEVHAVDYLLKPYERDRFYSALDAASERVRARKDNHVAHQVSSLLTQLRDRNAGAERIPVKSDGRIIFVNIADIQWIEAANNYVALHVGAKTHLVRETMTKLESRLPSDRFVRINRSNIVNVDVIRELKPKFHGDYTVVLKDSTRLTLSRNHRDKLESLVKDTLR